MLRLLEKRVRWGKQATGAGQKEGGPAAKEAGVPEEGGGRRREEERTRRGRPQPLKAAWGRLSGREPLRRRHGNRGAPKHS